jgi:hypothetical protein
VFSAAWIIQYIIHINTDNIQTYEYFNTEGGKLRSPQLLFGHKDYLHQQSHSLKAILNLAVAHT